MRLQVESEVVPLWFGFCTPALAYGKGGGSKCYAHSAGPDFKDVFSVRQYFLVGFRPYGHAHRFS